MSDITELVSQAICCGGPPCQLARGDCGCRDLADSARDAIAAVLADQWAAANKFEAVEFLVTYARKNGIALPDDPVDGDDRSSALPACRGACGHAIVTPIDDEGHGP